MAKRIKFDGQRHLNWDTLKHLLITTSNGCSVTLLGMHPVRHPTDESQPLMIAGLVQTPDGKGVVTRFYNASNGQELNVGMSFEGVADQFYGDLEVQTPTKQAWVTVANSGGNLIPVIHETANEYDRYVDQMAENLLHAAQFDVPQAI
jgi:hypothetical protein